MRCHFTPARKIVIKRTDKSAGEDVEKLGPSHATSGNVKWCSHCEKQFGGFTES